MAIMMIAFSSILMVESASINTSTKSKQMNVVGMLAKGLAIETEYKLEGKPFNEIKKEDSGTFPEPWKDYSWKREIKEVKLPNLVRNQSSGDNKDADSAQSETQNFIQKLITKYLSESLREVTITITWKKGTGEQSFNVSSYWVNLNNEFKTSE